MYLTIIDIQRQQEDKQLEINITVGNRQYSYIVEIYDNNGIVGIFFENTLKEALMKNLDENKFFTELIVSFYQGKQIKFPVELGYFKL